MVCKEQEELIEILKDCYQFAKSEFHFDKPIKLILKRDQQNAEQGLFAKTAFYNPDNFSITIFMTNRHTRDILGSFFHEIFHHSQNCSGLFKNVDSAQDGYFLEDDYLNQIEEDAYKRGCMACRKYRELKQKEKGDIR